MKNLINWISSSTLIPNIFFVLIGIILLGVVVNWIF
jgi:hypothetical protein